jgi:ComF family protein
MPSEGNPSAGNRSDQSDWTDRARAVFALAKSAAAALSSLLYPPRCEYCAQTIAASAYLCGKCQAAAPRVRKPRCEICSQPFHGEIEGKFACPSCQERKLHFECAVAPYESQGVVRELIHRFKYQGHFHLRHQLGRWLCEGFQDERLLGPADLILPVPLHPTRQREREFNQAAELAKIAAKTSQIPYCEGLRRLRYTTTQTRFDRQHRMENLRNAFGLRKNTDVRNKHLILIDDVLTTGSTLEECARVLRRAGAASVRGLTIARG